jgi:hypothetical protein
MIASTGLVCTPGFAPTKELLPQLAQLIGGTGERLSEYSLANLYLYRGRHAYVFRETPVPHVLGTTYDGETHALPLAPLGLDEAEALLADVDCIGPVGAIGPSLAERLGLAIGWNEDDSDYVFDAARLATLSGAKTKRAQARAFETAVRPAFEPIDARHLPFAFDVLEGWSGDVGKTATETDLFECREALQLMKPLGLEGWLVLVGDEPAAFLLAGPSADGGKIIHFAKGRRAKSAAYPWMFSRYAAAIGSGWINFEQDLGNPGFAQAKRAFAPMARLRKYRLRRKR